MTVIHINDVTKAAPHPVTPSEDLHTLIELAYASKDEDVRDAAGRVDTWACRLKCYWDYLAMREGLK